MAGEEFVGILNAVMPKFLKGAADLTVRRRLLLKMMEARGLITFNHSSFKFIWAVEYAQPAVEAYGDGGQLNFERGDFFKQAELDWRGYKATDLMTEKEKDMAKSDVMIVERYKKKIPRLLKAMRDKFGSELYIDGNLAGNENRMHGAASWNGDDGATVVADRVANPSDNYANISTSLAQFDMWTSELSTPPSAQADTDWPEGGAGDTVGYDYWSPKLANWSSTSWGTNTNTWLANGEFVLRKMVQWLSLTADTDGSSLVGIFAGDLFTDFKNAMSSKGRDLLPHPEARDLGFPEVLNFEGLRMQAEFGVKPNTFWMFNVEEMEMRSLKKQLFGTLGPTLDPKTASWLFQAGFFGNMTWGSPKFHGYGTNFAAS